MKMIIKINNNNLCLKLEKQTLDKQTSSMIEKKLELTAEFNSITQIMVIFCNALLMIWEN